MLFLQFQQIRNLFRWLAPYPSIYRTKFPLPNVAILDQSIPGQIAREIEASIIALTESLPDHGRILDQMFDVFHDNRDSLEVRLGKFVEVGTEVASLLNKLLPEEICRSFSKLPRSIGFDVIRIQGWPLGQIGGTPMSLGGSSNSGIAPATLAGICQLLGGRPTQFFDAISPSVESSGSTPQLGFHRDGCDTDRVSISTLLCLRSSGGGKTVFATLDELLVDFPDKHLEQLEAPIVASSSGPMVPALIRVDGKWTFHHQQRFNQTYIEATTQHSEPQRQAIEEFGKLAGQNLDRFPGIVLNPGDMISFINHHPSRGILLHGRTAYTDAADPAHRRWVKLINCET